MKKILFPLLILMTACQATPETSSQEEVETPTENRFEDEISAFEAADSLAMPAPGSVLFVGSSSIRFWNTLEEDMAPLPVINRGFGGSTFDDLLFYMDRIVMPYQPSAVVLYEGDNDIASDQTQPQDVVVDLLQFLMTLTHN